MTTLLMVSCSKNDDNSPTPVVETKFYPKKIDFFSKDMQGVETFAASTTFSYNDDKQVSSINYQGIIDIHFTYNANGLPGKMVLISGSNQSVCEFEYNGDRIIRLKRNNDTYNVSYNPTTNTYSYTDQYSTHSFTLNSAKDLTRIVRLNNADQTTVYDKEFSYKNDGFGFLYDIDYPISFYLRFIGLGIELDHYISIKPLEKTITTQSGGSIPVEYTNILNADNYVTESFLTWDNSGAGTILRFEYEEL